MSSEETGSLEPLETSGGGTSKPSSGGDSSRGSFITADSPEFYTRGGTPADPDSSKSVSSSVYEFPKENGRTYHGYRAGTYWFPNDQDENERLDFQFEIFKFCFQGKNYFAPLKDPKTILDIGTGTGLWAIEMGDEFPDAEVQGTDLSPIQPDSVPENVHFFIDDASEEDWALPPGYFDYVHTRILLGCFEDFKEIIRRAFHYIKPGGYMESQEFWTIPCCDDGTMPKDWPFLEWVKYADDAAMEAGRPFRIANKLKRWYEAAGFVDVQEKIFKMPLNPWPKDKHLKSLGRLAEENWMAGLQGFSMAYFSRAFNWTKDEIEVYLVNVRKAICDQRVHAYHKVYVVWGRKPDTPTATTTTESSKTPAKTEEPKDIESGLPQAASLAGLSL